MSECKVNIIQEKIKTPKRDKNVQKCALEIHRQQSKIEQNRRKFQSEISQIGCTALGVMICQQ